MKLQFWKKDQTSDKRETIIQISASEGGVQNLYVKAQSPEEAETLMKKLKELAK